MQVISMDFNLIIIIFIKIDTDYYYFNHPIII